MSKKNISLLVGIVTVGIGAFYGGIKYEKNKMPADLINLTSEQRQRFQQMGSNLSNGTRINRGGVGFISGDILAKDDKSITIKLNDGGSKIVFFSANSDINKYIAGSPDDLIAGVTVSINGDLNQDGSITAQTIQIRPNMLIPSSK